MVYGDNNNDDIIFKVQYPDKFNRLSNNTMKYTIKANVIKHFEI